MKLKCDSKLIRDALQIATKACSSKPSMPILSAVHIKADRENNRVFVTGNSLDISIATSFPAAVEEAGGVCIEGRRFSQIASAVEEGEVALEANNRSQATFACGRSKYRIMGIPEGEFPKTQQIEGGATLPFTQEFLRVVLASVADAQSEDETRHVLNGICIERQKGGQISFVATDGKRMHVANVAPKDDASKGLSVIVPASTIGKVQALLGEEGTVLIDTDSRAIRFTIQRGAGDVILTSKVVEGNFPNWRPILPKYEATQAIRLSRAELAAAAARARLALDSHHPSLRLKVEGLALELIATSPDNGESRESIGCVNPRNLAYSVTLNATLLYEAVNGVGGDSIELLVHEKTPDVAPVLFAQGEAVKAIVMPVRLS